MNIEDECLFETYELRNDAESARKKFEGQKYLDPRCDPAFRALFDSEDALLNFLNAILHLDGELQQGNRLPEPP